MDDLRRVFLGKALKDERYLRLVAYYSTVCRVRLKSVVIGQTYYDAPTYPPVLSAYELNEGVDDPVSTQVVEQYPEYGPDAAYVLRHSGGYCKSGHMFINAYVSNGTYGSRMVDLYTQVRAILDMLLLNGCHDNKLTLVALGRDAKIMANQIKASVKAHNMKVTVIDSVNPAFVARSDDEVLPIHLMDEKCMRYIASIRMAYYSVPSDRSSRALGEMSRQLRDQSMQMLEASRGSDPKEMLAALGRGMALMANTITEASSIMFSASTVVRTNRHGAAAGRSLMRPSENDNYSDGPEKYRSTVFGAMSEASMPDDDAATQASQTQESVTGTVKGILLNLPKTTSAGFFGGSPVASIAENPDSESASVHGDDEDEEPTFELGPSGQTIVDKICSELMAISLTMPCQVPRSTLKAYIARDISQWSPLYDTESGALTARGRQIAGTYLKTVSRT